MLCGPKIAAEIKPTKCRNIYKILERYIDRRNQDPTVIVLRIIAASDILGITKVVEKGFDVINESKILCMSIHLMKSKALAVK